MDKEKLQSDVTEIIELLSVGIGFNDRASGEFRCGRCPLKAFKRLPRLIFDDKTKGIVSHIAKSTVLATSIAPAFVYYYNDRNIAAVCVEIFIFLTDRAKPADHSFSAAQRSLKAQILAPKVLAVLMRQFKQNLLCFLQDGDVFAAEALEMLLHLLRNLSAPGSPDSAGFRKVAEAHGQMIKAFEDELVLRSISALTTQSDRFSGREDNMALLLLSITFNLVSLEKCQFDDENEVGASQLRSEENPAGSKSDLSSLRHAEKRERAGNIRQSDWAAQYQLVSPNGNPKLLSRLTKDSAGALEPERRNAAREKTLIETRRHGGDAKTKTAIDNFVDDILKNGGFAKLAKTVFERIKGDPFSKNKKIWGRLFFLVGFVLFKIRETCLVRNRPDKAFSFLTELTKNAPLDLVAKAAWDYVEEIASFKGIKYAKVEWSRLCNPVIALREAAIAAQAQHGSAGNALFGAAFAADPAVFKSLAFLLREWRPSLNTIEYFKALVELTHYVLWLSKRKLESEADPTPETRTFSKKQPDTENFKTALETTPKVGVYCPKKFEALLAPLCNRKIIRNYVGLARECRSLSPPLVQMVSNFASLIGTGLDARKLFYSAKNLSVFYKILQPRSGWRRKEDELAELKSFCAETLCSFFDDAKKHPALVAENLFGLSLRACESLKRGDYEESDNDAADRRATEKAGGGLSSAELSSSGENGNFSDGRGVFTPSGHPADETEFE